MRSFSFAYVLVVAAIACGDNNPAVDATPECTSASECLGANECLLAACTHGICELSPVAAGTPLVAQTAGDCQQAQCDGSGKIVSMEDDSDIPAAKTCVDETCAAGVPTEMVQGIGAACGSGLMCDGGGDCVNCTLPNQCPGSDTECQVRSCQQGTCGFDNTPANTVTKAQVAGDCKTQICDGSGAFTDITNGSDVPNDNNACTNDFCTGSDPDHSNVGIGTVCGSGGLVCDGSGNCIL
jgi:hypothetical protein|nr:hypothetical protein [Kofleriaceae bacterium]